MTLLEFYKSDIRVESITLILSDPRLLNDFPQHDCFVVKGNPFLPFSILSTSFLCWRLRHTIDVIHFCNYSSNLWRLPKTAHVIVTIHDLMFMTCKDFYKSPNFSYFKTLYFKWLVNIAIKNCNLIQTVSDYTKNNLIQNFPVSKGKNILVSAPLADKSSIGYNVESKPFHKNRYLVYVGSDRAHKQLSWIIDEANTQENSNYILLVIGAKTDDSVSSSSVHFLENVSDEELQNIYRFAEANILMSIDEGYGLSVKEAAANMCVS
ncbi:MAG: glycosyltransferase, partial [Emcibacteraceae bacterium]|nr:glycosyltransferase [Emcibacteraceae bacterium]